MPRIAMLSTHTSPLAMPGRSDTGGMNTYVRELSKHLSHLGVEVDIFTRCTNAYEPRIHHVSDKLRVISVEAGPLTPLHKSQVFDVLPQFVSNVEHFRAQERLHYDIVHSHYWLSGWAGHELKQKWNVPHVIMFHTTATAKNSMLPDSEDHPLRREIEQQLLISADAVIVASSHEKSLMGHLSSDDHSRIVAIPCGVDLELFQPIDKQRAKSLLGFEGSKLVLFVGRLVPLKGIDILIEAASRLVPTTPNLKVLIVGGEGSSDPETDRLRHLADELDLDQHVVFQSAVSQSELPTYYSAADVCAIPSHYESFCLVATESLACGTPVVASKVGGLPAIIRDRYNGLLVPWRCPQEFAEKIGQILNDEAFAAELLTHSRPSVKSLAWVNIAEEIYKLYRSLLIAPRIGNNPALCLRICQR